MSRRAESVVCPSAPARPGATTLLGILGRDGRLAYVPSRPVVSEGLLADFHATGQVPEAQARFAGRCVTAGCAFWDGDRCRAVDVARLETGRIADEPSHPLPECGIRSSCRWWQQDGASACAVCPHLTTAAPTAGDTQP